MLDQCVYVIPNYNIIFSSYEHPICGPHMRYVYLHELDTNIRVTLCQDNPGDSGLPCFFTNEIIILCHFIFSNKKQILNNEQILYLLNQIILVPKTITNNLKINENNDDLYLFDDAYIGLVYNSQSNYHEELVSCEIHGNVKSKHGYDITNDTDLCECFSVRSTNSTWNHKQKKSFGRFYYLLFSDSVNLFIPCLSNSSIEHSVDRIYRGNTKLDANIVDKKDMKVIKTNNWKVKYTNLREKYLETKRRLNAMERVLDKITDDLSSQIYKECNRCGIILLLNDDDICESCSE